MDDDHKPRTVKALLADVKDSSELMVDLAYGAVFFEDAELAAEVRELEEEMLDRLFQLREVCVLSARSPEDAHHMAGVLGIASAVENIVGAAADIANVIVSGLGIPNELRRDLKHADEVLARVQIGEDAPGANQSLRSLSLPSKMGIWVVASRRERDWNFNPDADHVVTAGEVVLISGPEEGIHQARRTLGAIETEPAEIAESGLEGLEQAVDLLVELKNSAEAAVGLAYSALLFNDRALALEVSHLESRSDEIQEEFETWLLKTARVAPRPEDLRGLIHLAVASETIFDAAKEMTRLVEKGEELHPVVAAALVESDEVGHEAVVSASSAAVSKSIKDLGIESATGMFVLAVQRGRLWTYRPSAGLVFEPDDRVISVGPDEGAEKLDRIFGVVRETEDE